MEPKNQDINCFWLDDRPEAIESIKEQLENRGIKVRIFSNSTQALRAIKNTIESKKNEGDIELFNVGIADLLLSEGETKNRTGISFANIVINLYKQYFSVPARLGTITAHSDLFREDLRKASFMFQYETVDLRVGEIHIRNLETDIRKCATQFYIDLESYIQLYIQFF